MIEMSKIANIASVYIYIYIVRSGEWRVVEVIIAHGLVEVKKPALTWTLDLS
jgi:hypothetical protein